MLTHATSPAAYSPGSGVAPLMSVLIEPERATELGGTLTVTSTLGEGTTVRLELQA